jgi:hypothetical protein
MTQRVLARIGGASGIMVGFAFWPILQDDFWKFLAVALPSTISIVVSVLSSWKKLRELFVGELAALLKTELRAATDEELERIKNVFNDEREKLAEEVTDQVWYRIDTINKLTGKVRIQNDISPEIQKSDTR